MYWNVVQRFGGEELWRRLLHVMREVADKHKTSLAAVALQWVLGQGGGGVAYPIVGECSQTRTVLATGRPSLCQLVECWMQSCQGNDKEAS